MASLYTEDFEGAASGTTVSTSNTTATVVTGTPTLSNAQSVTGSQSLRCVASANRQALEFHFTATSTPFCRAYVRMPTVAANQYFLYSFAGTTQIADMRVGTNGAITVRNEFVAVWSSAAGFLPANDWFRVEWSLVAGTSQRVQLFKGANLHGTTPDADSGVVGLTPSTNPNRFIVGFNTNSTLEGFFDAVAGDNATWVGPAVTPDPEPEAPTNGAFIFDGTDWVPAVPHVRTDGEWTPTGPAL